MRLLRLEDGDELTLTKELTDNLPPYAILSHTWGSEEDEVTFQDITGKTWKNKLGYKKILFCGKQAQTDNLEYFWVDTCCIDKTKSAELSESIISMFKWYQNAKICYVYLADVSSNKWSPSDIPRQTWLEAFRRSKWFSRGWTLQELLAPTSVRFFDQCGSPLGDKTSLKQQVCDITGIAEAALLGAPLTNVKFSERYEWARSRQTTREEDWAYSLQGIFGVFLTPRYGEGRANASRQLVKEIKEALLGTRMQTFIIDAIGHRKVVSPLLLDLALLETLVLFDEARAEAEHYDSSISRNTRILRINDVLVSNTVDTFITFLRGLLWSVAYPIAIHMRLETQLNVTADVLRGVITSNKEIALGIQRDEGYGQKTLEKLETTQDFIRGQIEVSTQKMEAQSPTLEEIDILKEYIRHTKLVIEEVEEKKGEEEKQQLITKEVEKILQQDAEYARLREQVPKLSEECQQLQLTLELAMKQLKAQRTMTDAKVKKLEMKKEEAERMRIESESKTILQKIWDWISYFLSWVW